MRLSLRKIRSFCSMSRTGSRGCCKQYLGTHAWERAELAVACIPLAAFDPAPSTLPSVRTQALKKNEDHQRHATVEIDPRLAAALNQRQNYPSAYLPTTIFEVSPCSNITIRYHASAKALCLCSASWSLQTTPSRKAQTGRRALLNGTA